MKKLILIFILLLSGCSTIPYEPIQSTCSNYILKEYEPSFIASLWERQRFFQREIDCWTYRMMPDYKQSMYEKKEE
jgi:PBP1b-binding outer membrane lipoprotein LpoB